MKVKAIKLGFLGNRRIREGEIFNLADKNLFSSVWMEEVDVEKNAELKDRPLPKLKFNAENFGKKNPVNKDVI